MNDHRIDAASESFLRLSGIGKAFGPNRVLDNVDFEVSSGQVVAIVGQNGAGKSTLMNIIAGVLQPSEGQIFLEGAEIHLESPRAASNLGIRMVHQELSLFTGMTIMENLLIGNLPRTVFRTLDWQAMREKSRQKMRVIGLELDEQLRVSQVSIAKQQMIEICREIDEATKILILDEPTSAIGTEEVAALFQLIRKLKNEQGTSFIYISHRLDEVLEIADSIYTLRDGAVVSAVQTHAISHEGLIRTIVGESGAEALTKREFAITREFDADAPPALEVTGVCSGVLRNITFALRQGEVLGFAGLTGSGRTEILKTVYGAIPYDSGFVGVRGRRFERGHTCHQALRSGICLIPEDRKEEGLNLGLSLKFNISVASLDEMTNSAGLLSRSSERKLVLAQIQRFHVKTFDMNQQTRLLSGGNQQKVCLSKWTVKQPRILLLDEPTKGIDIGAKEEIFGAIDRLTADGVSVLFVSSEFKELLRICHRIIVLRNGTIFKELVVDDGLTEDNILYYATGGDASAVAAEAA